MRRMVSETAQKVLKAQALNEETNTLEVGTNASIDGVLTVEYDSDNAPIKLDGADIDNDGNILTYSSLYKITLENSGDPHVFEFKTDGIYLDDVKITN